MTRTASSVLALLALMACSRETEPQQQVQARSDRTEAALPTVGATSSPTRSVGSPLTAQVSGLTADVSALTVRVTEIATIVDLAADTLFAFDSADLSPAASANLLKLADLIRRGAPGPVAIAGHTDAKGEDAYNLALSERRARAVETWLKGQAGVSQRSFTVSGKGKADPVAPNERPDGSDDPEGRAKNRRVVVTIPR